MQGDTCGCGYSTARTGALPGLRAGVSTRVHAADRTAPTTVNDNVRSRHATLDMRQTVRSDRSNKHDHNNQYARLLACAPGLTG
eukprot:2899847-Prymnesium_polylepis.1